MRRERLTRRAALLIAGALVAALPLRAAASDLPVIAVFDFELVDTSLEGELRGPSTAELARLARISDLLREELVASGRFRVVAGGPAAGQGQRMRDCNGCERALAAELGADFALIGWVQKVSNLILNLNVAVREVASGRLATAASVDIRGNTDQSWARGTRYLVRHRLLAG